MFYFDERTDRNILSERGVHLMFEALIRSLITRLICQKLKRKSKGNCLKILHKNRKH